MYGILLFMGPDLFLTISKLERFRKANPKTQVTLSLTVEGRDLISKLRDRFAILCGSKGVKVNSSLVIEMLIRLCFTNLSGLGVPPAEIDNQDKSEESVK